VSGLSAVPTELVQALFIQALSSDVTPESLSIVAKAVLSTPTKCFIFNVLCFNEMPSAY
jgi:hypothetical protein